MLVANELNETAVQLRRKNVFLSRKCSQSSSARVGHDPLVAESSNLCAQLASLIEMSECMQEALAAHNSSGQTIAVRLNCTKRFFDRSVGLPTLLQTGW